jgi:hypothetical protein
MDSEASRLVSERPAGRYRLITGRLAAGGVELHVLARAYSAAWIALHAEPPTGPHPLSDLGITIDFGDAGPRTKSSRRRRDDKGVRKARRILST